MAHFSYHKSSKIHNILFKMHYNKKKTRIPLKSKKPNIQTSYVPCNIYFSTFAHVPETEAFVTCVFRRQWLKVLRWLMSAALCAYNWRFRKHIRAQFRRIYSVDMFEYTCPYTHGYTDTYPTNKWHPRHIINNARAYLLCARVRGERRQIIGRYFRKFYVKLFRWICAFLNIEISLVFCVVFFGDFVGGLFVETYIQREIVSWFGL